MDLVFAVVAFSAGEGMGAAVIEGAFFLCPRFDTTPVVVLLFSDDACEFDPFPLPLFALRVLRLRAITGRSGKVPIMGVAVLEARPARVVVVGVGAGTSMCMLSGS